jgi:hypothetical protein
MDSRPYSLDFWIGQEVGALIPAISKDCLGVTIRGVESGGVWLECEQLTVSFCCGRPVPERDDVANIVAFFPFSQIVYVATLDRKTMMGPARIITFAGARSSTPTSCKPEEEDDNTD